MTSIISVVVILFILALLLLGSVKAKSQKELLNSMDRTAFKARRPLTAFEQEMFFVLTAALPECIVLAQVAFSALVTARHRGDRNKFDRKVTDFLICSKQLTPIAIIELDDKSHDTKKDADQRRDEFMLNIGYHTIRYQRIPTAETIQQDIADILAALTNDKNMAPEANF